MVAAAKRRVGIDRLKLGSVALGRAFSGANGRPQASFRRAAARR